MAGLRTGFSRLDRLLRPQDFRRVAREGRRAVARFFVVVVAPSARANGKCWPRLGVTVSRRVGGAVVRNRIKRHVREWFRGARADLPRGVDLVVIARRGAGELSSAEISANLRRLAPGGESQSCA